MNCSFRPPPSSYDDDTSPEDGGGEKLKETSRCPNRVLPSA